MVLVHDANLSWTGEERLGGDHRACSPPSDAGPLRVIMMQHACARDRSGEGFRQRPGFTR